MKTYNDNNEECNSLAFDKIVSHPLNSSVGSMNSYMSIFCPAISKVPTPNMMFDMLNGHLSLNFFGRNFIDIILGPIRRDLDTQN